MMLGNTSKALAGFAALTSSPVYANASRFYQGYIYYTQGEYAEARHLLTLSTNTPHQATRPHISSLR